MKTRYSCIFGIMAMLMLVSSFVIPGKLVNPTPVSADPGLMEWTIVDTMDSLPAVTDNILSPIATETFLTSIDGIPETGSEIIKLVVASDGNTMYAIVRVGAWKLSPYYGTVPGTFAHTSTVGNIVLYKSTNGGRTWSGSAQGNLFNSMTLPQNGAVQIVPSVWDVAIAPDNPNMVAVVVSRKANLGNFLDLNGQFRHEVWLSTDGCTNFDNTMWPPTGISVAFPAPPADWVSDLQISMDYGSARDLMVATRGRQITGNIQIMKIPSFGGWNIQDIFMSTGTDSVNEWTGSVTSARFSPTYVGDSTIAVVYSCNAPGLKAAAGTYLVTGTHDLSKNITTWQVESQHVEIKNQTSPAGKSPTAATIINSDLELPSDFSGQSASLRRFYISTDSIEADTTVNRGVFRVDDTIIYTLMDNSTTSGTAATIFSTSTRRAHSIAYWGTYASGKLLVGETMGSACKAAVPTWFTDSPTVCPVPCWYPAKKPVSGAAGQLACTQNTYGYGNAYVVWSPTFADQGVAYAVTGSSAWGAWVNPELGTWTDSATAAGQWPLGLLNIVILDESAFALTRNNGETWNELSLIDTRIAKLTDVAPSADCTTVYLASVNNGTNCTGFDSVWRSSTNEKVVAPPLPALPIGSYWERVRVSPTALVCTDPQSNHAILRLAPDKNDGQVVFWAAGGTGGIADMHMNTHTVNASYTYKHYPFVVGANTKAIAWTPDYGDFWGDISPRITVEDMAAESSTALYIIDQFTNMQKMPYSGTAWSSSIATVSPTAGHTVEATGLGRVVAAQGKSSTGSGPGTASVSTDGGKSFRPLGRTIPGESVNVGFHAIFDTDFETNATIYAASDMAATLVGGVATLGSGGKIYRNKFPAGAAADWEDMIEGWTNHREYYGLAQTNSKNVSGQGTLYAAHTAYAWGAFSIGGIPVGGLTAETLTHTAGWYGGVERTLRPLDGIPKPGIVWDCLDAASFYRTQASVIEFTLEPKSLKICGCLTQDTNATLYAIDNAWYASNTNFASKIGDVGAFGARGSGMLWAYTDCVAKVGPKLTMDDNTIIGCDPATGRNQEVNFTWEQLCIANWYEIRVGKDKAFAMKIFGGVFTPASVTSPALVYLSGGEGTYPAMWETPPEYLVGSASPTSIMATKIAVPSLECGHTYYWSVRVRNETTDDWVRSPWSDVRGFTIKAGFRVTTPYYGPQLLAPDNGCGCACDAPLCFSWSPFKETVEYKFEMSKNPDMSSPLVSTTTKGTAYQYTGKADCNTNYFWRVQATKPAPSEWSATYSFMTQKAPPPPPTPEPPPGTPMWVWVVIAIGTILVIVTLVLIFKTRRV